MVRDGARVSTAAALCLLLAAGGGAVEKPGENLVPRRNVRVEARIVDRETGREAEMNAAGQLTISYPESSAGGEVYFHIDDSRSSKSTSATQFVVVASGAEASIRVGRDIPYQSWFYLYGRERGVIGSGVDWREVGSSLSVRPTVLEGGGSVLLRVVPELDYLVEVGRSRRNKRRQEVAFAGVATEVIVASGEEVSIGGSAQEEGFYERLLTGYDRQRRVRAVDIFVRATVLNGVSP